MRALLKFIENCASLPLHDYPVVSKQYRNVAALLQHG